MPSSTASLGLLLARVPIGVYFAIAGWNKLATIGAAGFVEKNLASAVRYMPESVARPWLTALPFTELVIGLMVVLGLGVRLAGAVMALLLVSFLVAATPLAPNIAKVVGEGGKPFEANVIYLGLALLLMLAGGGRFGIDGAFHRRHLHRRTLRHSDGSTQTIVTAERTI